YALHFKDLSKTDHSQRCAPIPVDPTKGLCSLADVDLGDIRVPEVHLDITLAIFPHDELSLGDSDETVCPDDIAFIDGTDVPYVKNPPTTGAGHRPAIGGRGTYYKRDSETVVSIGCSDVSLVDPAMCPNTVVTATLLDFDSRH